jgi:hypothetical protein
LVRPRGLEPPQDFSYNDLNVARLPVPPWPHKTSYVKITKKKLPSTINIFFS